MKNLLLIIMFLNVIVGEAQTCKYWNVVDSASKSPVPYAFVLDITTRKGGIADENGAIKLFVSDSNHWYLVSSIGYDTVQFRAGSITNCLIVLTRKPLEFDTVVIHGTGITCAESWGPQKKANRAHGSFDFQIGGEVAVFMPNEKREKGYIQKVRFYIGKDGYATAKFRVKFYQVDSISGGPGKLLLENDIIMNAERENNWAVLDISAFNVAIPETGLFVAMEWLPNSKRYEILHKADTLYGNGQSLGVGKQSSICATWVKSLDGEWTQLSSFGTTGGCKNAMIGVDVIIFCNDSDTER